MIGDGFRAAGRTASECLELVLVLSSMVDFHLCVYTRRVCSSVGRNYRDRGRAEKNIQRIACQLLEGRAREVPICCKRLSAKGGNGTEGCGGIRWSRIAWLFPTWHSGFLRSAKRVTFAWLRGSRDVTSRLQNLRLELAENFESDRSARCLRTSRWTREFT